MGLYKTILTDADYMITPFGEVRRKARKVYYTRLGRDGVRIMPEKVLSQSIASHGYKIVTLNGVSKYLHRLLAEAFIPNPENKATVNHKDGNKLNNNLDNLEWSSYKENNDHAKRLGLNKEVGETHHNAKLKEADVFNIKFMLGLGYTQRKLASFYNIDQSVISDIKREKMWTHVRL